MERFGRIDGLINNAAIYQRPAVTRGPFEEIPVEEWDRLMGVNLRGVFLCCRAVVPHMKAQGSGKIVNISSGTVFNGSTQMLHYVTSKAGVIGLTRSLARELGDYNINVNAIAPGLTVSMDDDDEDLYEGTTLGADFERAPSIPDQIEQLARLREREIITTPQFESKRDELLARM